MTERYEPASEFLKAILADDVPLTGSVWADENLRLLIAMVDDGDRSNRDWAAFLLAHADVDTPAMREALLRLASDPDQDTRAEAIFGLARRDREVALPYVARELATGAVGRGVIEAAALVAHASLVEELTGFLGAADDAENIEDEVGYRCVAAAIRACESGVPDDSSWFTSGR